MGGIDLAIGAIGAIGVPIDNGLIFSTRGLPTGGGGIP
jgi:hypothetical protein